MARPLLGSNLTIQKLSFLPAPLTFFIMLTAVISVFTIVTSLCGSHEGIVKSLRGKEGKRTVRLAGGKKKKKKIKSSLSNKALLMAKMISWRKVQDDEGLEDEEEEEEEEGEDGVVWKKTIIKGEKCRPIDFSGKILYDSDGNRLPD